MAKVRKISRVPASGKNYYVVDANFLVNKHIPAAVAPAGNDRDRIQYCVDWWQEIDAQLSKNHARVYVPDICIAEAFKVLAKKYFWEGWFTTNNAYLLAKRNLEADVKTSTKTLRAANRRIKYHDVSTNRDIIVGVDRFYEPMMNAKKKVQIADLVFVATAKYLMDFYDLPKDRVHMVTLDGPLREGITKINELPNAYDPTKALQRAALVFE